MSGGLVQLLAIGQQDAYLTGDPEMTFFKSIYKRHTNFAMETIEQFYQYGIANFGNKVRCKIARNGDLLHRIYVQNDVTLNGGQRCNHLGHTILKETEVHIGGQLVDKHYSQWLQCWAELTELDYKRSNPIGNNVAVSSYVQNPAAASDNQDNSYTMYDQNNGYLKMAGDYTMEATTNNKRVMMYTPLKFWFCTNPGLALPLISLQYMELFITIIFEDATRIVSTASDITLNSSLLLCEYIFLDTDERTRFATTEQQYLIEQLQLSGPHIPPTNTNEATNFRLNFIHPCKELVWCINVRTSNNINTGECAFIPLCDGFTINRLDGSTPAASITSGLNGSVKLTLNGDDRFEARPMSYFTRVQPWNFHTNTPVLDRIGIYSFAMNPEKHQPSGTCNFSRIDTGYLAFQPAYLNIDSSNANLYIFATNYNILKLSNGMGGIMYNN